MYIAISFSVCDCFIRVVYCSQHLLAKQVMLDYFNSVNNV